MTYVPGSGVGFVLGGLIDELSAYVLTRSRYLVEWLTLCFFSAGWRGCFFLLAGLCALSIILALLSVEKDKPSTETDRLAPS